VAVDIPGGGVDDPDVEVVDQHDHGCSVEASADAGGHTLQANGISADNVPRSANLGIVLTDQGAPTPGVGDLPATGRSSAVLSVFAVALLAAGVLIVLASRRRVV